MLVLLLLNLRIFSQESEDEIYSLSQSISFGWSSPISLARSIVDPVQQEKIGFLIDYQLYNNEKNSYRARVKFSPMYSK